MSRAGAAETITVGYLAQPSDDVNDLLRRYLPDGWVLRPSNGDADSPDFQAALPELDYVVVSATRFERRHLDRAPRLKLVQKLGIGHDDIDSAALKNRGVALAVCPVGAAEVVAEHTLALTLASLKATTELDTAIRNGEWPRWEYRRHIRQLSGRTVGLVGFGGIGRAAAERFASFGCDIVVYRNRKSIADGNTANLPRIRLAEKLDDVFTPGGIVSLHVPLTPETRHMVGEAQLARLGPDGLIVNTSRGSIIDQAALVRVLRDGRLGYAALDVFEQEPPAPGDPLLGLRNTLFTPHLAGGGLDVLERRVAFVASNIDKYHRTGMVDGRIDLTGH